LSANQEPKLNCEAMTRLFDSSRFQGFPKSKYEAMDEVQSFLEFNGVDLGQVFEVLLDSNDGYLIYAFGNAEVQFTRGFHAWSREARTDAAQMSIKLENEKRTETNEHVYALRDLKLVKRKKQFSTKEVSRNRR
jgi:hypothetical protein